MPTPGQTSLSNFYRSVAFSYPVVAAAISEDVIEIAIYSLAADKTPAHKNVEHLRQMTSALPEVFIRVRDNTLRELGYS